MMVMMRVLADLDLLSTASRREASRHVWERISWD